MTLRNKRRLLLTLIPVGILLAAGVGYAGLMMAPPPADLDLSLTQTSEQGLFTATLVPAAEPIEINRIETWTVEITMADGSGIAPESITVDGGMPQHGHGLPTEPQVVEDLGDGRFTVEGMKFNMPGWWVLNVHLETAAGPDTATFNLSL